MPLPLLPVLALCPSPAPNPAVQVEVLSAGFVHDDWKRVVDDGSAGPVSLPLLVGVIHHGDDLVLVDAGLGLTTRDGSYPGFPLTALGDMEVPPGAAMVERLDRAPDLVLMTHLHYDHVGGLYDFPGIEVWTTREDWRTYGGGALGFPRSLKQAVNWVPQDLRAGAASQVLGRPALDVFGDQSVWYLSLPGHTPGAAAVLVRAEDGPWLFIGDTAWVDRHLEGARRPAVVRALIDADPRQVAEGLAWAADLRACPGLRVVAGHEPSLAEGLPSSPQP